MQSLNSFLHPVNFGPLELVLNRAIHNREPAAPAQNPASTINDKWNSAAADI